MSRGIVRGMASTIKERAVVDRRWYYVTMVAGAIAISYFDRQTISVAIESQGWRVALRTGDYGGKPGSGPIKTLIAGSNGIALTPFEAAICSNR